MSSKQSSVGHLDVMFQLSTVVAPLALIVCLLMVPPPSDIPSEWGAVAMGIMAVSGVLGVVGWTRTSVHVFATYGGVLGMGLVLVFASVSGDLYGWIFTLMVSVWHVVSLLESRRLSGR